MGTLLLLAVLAVSNPGVVQSESSNRSIEETVDVIELHRCFDFRGKLAFQQLIFYRWSRYHRRFQVVDTVVVTSQSMIPRRSKNGLFRSVWKDGSSRRMVQALTFRRSESSSDPEVPERQYVPIELRRGLKKSGEQVPAEKTIQTAAKIRPEKLLKY